MQGYKSLMFMASIFILFFFTGCSRGIVDDKTIVNLNGSTFFVLGDNVYHITHLNSTEYETKTGYQGTTRVNFNITGSQAKDHPDKKSPSTDQTTYEKIDRADAATFNVSIGKYVDYGIDRDRFYISKEEPSRMIPTQDYALEIFNISLDIASFKMLREDPLLFSDKNGIYLDGTKIAYPEDFQLSNSSGYYIINKTIYFLGRKNFSVINETPVFFYSDLLVTDKDIYAHGENIDAYVLWYGSVTPNITVDKKTFKFFENGIFADRDYLYNYRSPGGGHGMSAPNYLIVIGTAFGETLNNSIYPRCYRDYDLYYAYNGTSITQLPQDQLSSDAGSIRYVTNNTLVNKYCYGNA